MNVKHKIMKRSSIATIIAVVVLVAGGLVYWYSTQPSQPYSSANPTNPIESPTSTQPAPTAPTATPFPSGTSAAPMTATVAYTDNGFSPATVTVAKGGTVTFKNMASNGMWVGSNPHPLHNGYPAAGGCAGSTFDSCQSIPPGVSWSFTFTFAGSWDYHNHLHPSEGGTVVVQ